MRRPWETTNDLHARLAHRAAGGDQAAFVALYRDLYPAVARFVGRRVRAAADAEDVVAQVFHRLLEALPRLDGTRGSILGYALTTARNALADAHRAGGGHAALDSVPEQADQRPGAQQLLESRDASEALRRAVAALPDEARQLLDLRFGDGLRHAEIAALTSANEAAVKQRLSRLLRALRGALGERARPTREATP
jgi:RNA polymerase sigma-70 factor (ECF subfamily)